MPPPYKTLCLLPVLVDSICISQNVLFLKLQVLPPTCQSPPSLTLKRRCIIYLQSPELPSMCSASTPNGPTSGRQERGPYSVETGLTWSLHLFPGPVPHGTRPQHWAREHSQHGPRVGKAGSAPAGTRLLSPRGQRLGSRKRRWSAFFFLLVCVCK